MKALTLLAAGLVASMLGACSSTPTQTPAQALSTLQVQSAKACVVAQSTLSAVVAADSTLAPDQQAVIGKVNAAVTTYCTAKIDFSSVQAFAQTTIPLTINAVSSSSLPQDKKNEIDLALIGLSAALSAAVVQYAPVATAPASGAVAASAPAVAVPASAASGV